MREAHHVRPTVMIGKEGLTPSVVETARQSLSHHELVKVKWVNFRSSRHEMLSELAEQTGSEKVASIGYVGILYRRNLDPERCVLPGVPRE